MILKPLKLKRNIVKRINLTATMKLWITRNKDGSLYLWRNKPIRQNNEDRFMYGGYIGELIQDLYPEVTWENSPKRITLKLEYDETLDCKG